MNPCGHAPDIMSTRTQNSWPRSCFTSDKRREIQKKKNIMLSSTHTLGRDWKDWLWVTVLLGLV